MGRRIFAEKHFDVIGHVLEKKDFKMYRDQDNKIFEGHFEKIIKDGERWLDFEIPALVASEYAMYRKNGNRTVYQKKCNPRRRAISELAIAESVEGKGRFIEKLADVMWAIMEETSWCIPAHNPSERELPYTYKGVFDYIDLFVAVSGANLAFAYYLCKDALDEYLPDIGYRVQYELDRRIIKPFINDNFINGKCDKWSGRSGKKVNNWNPWIISNVLTACALSTEDLGEREAVVSQAMSLLDNYTAWCPEDGGCDEGPQYWAVAGRALYNACELLYDITDGYINVYSDPLLKNIGEYAVKVIASSNNLFAFADSPANAKLNPIFLYHWGIACNSPAMISCAKNMLDGKLPEVNNISSLCYQSYKYYTVPLLERAEFLLPPKSWIPSIGIAVTREFEEIDRGLVLAFKGGHNDESHNHNDLGSIIIFSEGKPLFADLGCGEYTRRTFSDRRYEILSMRSEYHNCAMINGEGQPYGEKYYACDYEYDGETGSLKMNLKHAYPDNHNIEKYTRYAELCNSVITIEDDIELSSHGTVAFNYITTQVPQYVTDNSFGMAGRTVEFDSSLVYSIDKVDMSQEEMRGIPANLGTESVYRITLTAKEPVIKKKYIMTVR